ncbi:MAG TPA: NAD(P)H-hydrate dehydratase [Verrucomicrobiae bacterium]|nr:NAD(P)H-hydrate dehydratase [Verrucomicrobiae bacterium]
MSLPVISIGQMREWEQATWATGRTEAEVIRRVGEGLARRISQLTSPNDYILLLAGHGHNGDDVRASRSFLTDRRVDTFNVTSPAASLRQLELFLGQNPALVVDGLFGIGLNRPLDADWTALITRLNGAQQRVLAMDVPSGLNADTGETFGVGIQAALTLTVGAPKQGLLKPEAWPFVGQLEVVGDVGLISCPHTSELNWTMAEDFRALRATRPVAGHKGNFGHLAIIAGSVGYHGAAVLATRAAQRAQPGLVTVFTHEPAYYPVAMQLQSAMANAWSSASKLPSDATALLVGPGLAATDLPEDLRTTVRKLWRDATTPVIADASALDWLPLDHVPRNAVRVVTPHPGEAARLIKTTAARVQQDRPQALREISRRLGNCWVVLKGHQTLIGRSSGEIYINSSGNPHLAQGGSGDALAGFVAGLLAQPSFQSDVGLSLRYAAWQHGAAADALQARRRNWTVEDLVEEIGNQ